MAQYTRSHILIFPSKEYEKSMEDFRELQKLVNNALEGDYDALYEAFELSSNNDYIYFDDNCLDDNLDSIEIGLFSKGFFPIYNLTEAITDNYDINIYVAWCDEFEEGLEIPGRNWRDDPDFDIEEWCDNSGRVGVYRSLIAGWDEEWEEFYRTSWQQKYNGEENAECWFWPETPEMKHQVFCMAWDGWRPPDGGSAEPFFNQCNIDEKKLTVDGEPLFYYDEDGFVIDNMFFGAWVEKAFKEADGTRE